MKHKDASHTQSHLHRLAGIPVSYSPLTRTPLLFRMRASAWRLLFSAWNGLTPRRSSHGFGRPGPR